MAITLDKTGYQGFDTTPLPVEGDKVQVVQYNGTIDPVRSFFEYTGTVRHATENSIFFSDQHPLTVKFVSIGAVDFEKPSTEYLIRFNSFYTYRWKHTEGRPTTPLVVSSPTKGGKSRRKRKRRKTRYA
jgi:hypothetical protein